MPNFHTRSQKNFGYGRSLHFAGCNALKTTMVGQYHSVAAHSARWKQFCDWAKTQGIREARQINNPVLKRYADYLRARLEGEGKSLAVSTAQNRLSTCNCVLKALRGNNDIFIKPAEALHAKRQNIRAEPPEMSREKLFEALKSHGLNNRHDLRAAYACERYQAITGVVAPVMEGQRLCPKRVDREAREVIVGELGHNRMDVVAAYIGSSR